MNYHQTRSTVRKYILTLLSYFSKPAPGIHILNGHYLSLNDNAEKEILEELLNQLIRKNVKFIDFEVAVSSISENKIPENECLVAFTFDDGFKECYTKLRPVFNKFGLKAAFFINPGFIDGDEDYQHHFKKFVVETEKDPMNWEEIKALANEGHTIGAHTIDHTNLITTDHEVLDYQIGHCKRLIEEKLNKECKYFAFPFGKLNNFSDEALKISQKYYKYIFSQSNYRKYFSFDGEVINRRHFECDWPVNHVMYFLKNKS